MIDDLTRDYLENAASEWRKLRAGDAEILLTDVFVMLEAIAEPKRSPLERRHDIVLLQERLEHAEVSLRLEKPPSFVPISQALKEAHHLVLLGEPGAGKSTTLQFIALCFAIPHWARERLALDEECIPVLLNLPAHAEKLSAPGPTLEQALALEVNNFLRKKPEVVTDLVTSWRDTGRLLVLMDGLDEVPDSLRPAVRDEIVHFAQSSNGRECRIIVASRTAGYTPLGADFKEYTIKPFEKPEEARLYLARWLAVLKPEWKAQAEDRADRLLEGMRNQPALRRLLDNPLILRLSAEVYAATEKIAQNRAELYQRWIDEAWKRAVQRGAKPEEKERAVELLEETAWCLHNDLDPHLSDTDLSLLREKMGLLVKLNDHLAFAHATFREYFVARRLARAWQENREGAWAMLRPRLHLPKWREPLLLLAGMLKGQAAADLVQRVRRARSPYEPYLRRDLLLALWLASEAQLSSDVTQPLLQEIRQLWRHKDADVRRSVAWALGNIGSPKAIPALIEALRDREWWVRQAAAQALRDIGSPEAIPALIEALRDEEEDVRRAAAGALGNIGSPKAIPALIEALRDEEEDVRRAAAGALVNIGSPKAIPALIEALRDRELLVRQAAAGALGNIGSPKAIPALIEALRDRELLVRQAAAWALGNIGSPEAIPALIEALRDEEGDVRWAAAQALGNIGSPEAISALIEALRDEEGEVRQAAVEALAPCIARILPSSDPKERKDQEALVRQAVRTLARFRTGVYEPLSIAVTKLQELTLTYRDPFQPLPPSRWRRATRAALGAALAAALGLLAIFSGVLGELLKEQWKVALQTWLSTHLWALIALVAIAPVLGALLSMLLDWLKKSF